MSYKTPEARRTYWLNWYAIPANRDKHIKRNRAVRDKRLVEIRKWVNDYKVEHGCVDCGYNANAAALDLDHRDPTEKRNTVCMLVRNMNSLEGVKEEVVKCDVRCANCHRIKHANERQTSVVSAGCAAGPYKP